MEHLEFSETDILHDPVIVERVAKAVITQLPADAVIEVGSIVVTGGTAAVLLAHAVARHLECRVTLAELDAGIIEIDPPLRSGERVVILAGDGPDAVTLPALRETTERVAHVLAVCAVRSGDAVTITRVR